MKHLKRVIIVLYFIILLFVSIKTKAIGYDDTKKASYDANETVASFSTPFTTYQTDYGTSTFNGSESSQHVHIMTQHETNDSKIVPSLPINLLYFFVKLYTYIFNYFIIKHTKSLLK